jgi:FkbM family methyltransferase
MKIIANIFRKLSRGFNYIATKLDPPPPPPEPTEYELSIQQWKKDHGDRTLRITYNLNKESVVFDIGGYEGQWASDIFSKYQSNIVIFEPVKEFYENIKERFAQNPKMTIFPFGLGGKNQETEIFLDENASSILVNNFANKEMVQIVCISDFIIKNRIKKINLMKINIEGSEYDLLENLIETGKINSIENIQVQFHQFVENAQERRASIHESLKSTHMLTYEYPFVWENWVILKK